MRLIDADAFKADVLSGLYIYLQENKEDIARAIDNAPTLPLPDFKEGYKQAIKDGKTNFSRPQGEWNYIQAGMAVCPFCGATSHKQYKNFCPDCGADMRGKENGRNE